MSRSDAVSRPLLASHNGRRRPSATGRAVAAPLVTYQVYVGVGGAYSFAACLSDLTIEHASLSRRRTLSTPNRDASNIRALSTIFPYIP